MMVLFLIPKLRAWVRRKRDFHRKRVAYALERRLTGRMLWNLIGAFKRNVVYI